MFRHAMTGGAMIVIALAITLFFSTRTGKPSADPQLETRSTIVAFKRCDERLLALNTAVAQALGDTAHRDEKLAQAMRPAEHECTIAETAIRDSLARHPGDKRLEKMRQRNELGQNWLRELSVAIAAYEVAEKTGSASAELAKLQNLLQ